MGIRRTNPSPRSAWARSDRWAHRSVTSRRPIRSRACRSAAITRLIYGNSGQNGRICEVAFDLTQATTTTGSGVYTITAAANAAMGDYLLGYSANGWNILTPNFYIRIGDGMGSGGIQ